MKKIFLLSIVFIVMFCSCRKSDDTDYTAGQFGWTVGDIYDGYGTIFHTQTGGVKWVRQGSETTIPATSLNDVKALNNNEVWICGGYADGYGSVLKSTDAGESWVRLGKADQIPNVQLVGLSLLNSNTCYVCGDSGVIIKTTDGGQGWEILEVDTAFHGSFQMISASNQNNVWAGGIGDTLPVVYHSSDGGNNWVRQGLKDFPTGNIPNAIIDIHAYNSSLVWAVGPGIAFYTLDGGNNWIDKSPGVFLHNNGVCVINETSVWVATDNNNVYKLIGLNTNWENIHTHNQGVYSAEYMGVSAFDDANCWIVTAGNSGKGNILHTSDGGKNWVVQTPPYDINLRRISFVGALR